MLSLGALVQKGDRHAAELEQKRQLVGRVAKSELFQRSPRLREFLLYVADCTLSERLEDVREQAIAARVFQRRPDPGGQDSIVRAEARNLRKRLETYFTTEGAEEPVVLVMPKGAYSLAWVPRQNRLAEETREEEEARSPRPETKWLVWGIAGMTAVAIGALALALFWHAQVQSLNNRLGRRPAMLPFSAMFQGEDSTEIVTSDTGFFQISALLNRRVSLDEYVAREYAGRPETNPPNLIQNWNIYEYTDGREMAVAGLILRRNAEFAQRIYLRSGHSVMLQDFKDHNMVLIGSPVSNPWAQLYEDKLNFRCDVEPNGRICFRNKAARPGEQDIFPNEDDNAHHRTYARVAFLPKTSDASATLLIAGTTAQSTQAAGEFVTDPDELLTVFRKMGIDPHGTPRFFELLIRSNNFVGGAILREVVAVRTVGPPDH
jgi:hypothetical protein